MITHTHTIVTLCVCIYIYIYICIDISIYKQTYLHICDHIYIYIYTILHSYICILVFTCDENGISNRVSTIAATPRQRRHQVPPLGSRGPSPQSHRGAPNLLDHRLLISRVKTHNESLLKILIPSLCFVFWVLFNTESESIKLGL